MSFKKILKLLLPALVILALALSIASWMMKNREKVETVEAEEVVTRAEFIIAKKTNFKITLTTSGEVLPHTKTTLIPQVAGEVIRVSPNFRNGGFFKAGEILMELDQRDYLAAVTEAGATLAQSKAALALEKARSEQAIAAWRDLGRGGEPSELTARLPQLAEASASAEAAAARLARAQRDLERTKITAPYDGYVRDKKVDLGQVVNSGTPLGEIFAIDYVEVRLPIDPAEIRFLNIPELYLRGDAAPSVQPKVTLRDSNIPDVPWQGRVVRAEGEFDATSRKLFVIANVDDPYAMKEKNRPPLKVGQFVNAEIEGRTLSEVFVVPEQAVRFGNQVKVIDEENRIRFREVEVLWDSLPDLVIKTGLTVGERICLTPLPFAVDGALVEPVEWTELKTLEPTE